MEGTVVVEGIVKVVRMLHRVTIIVEGIDYIIGEGIMVATG